MTEAVQVALIVASGPIAVTIISHWLRTRRAKQMLKAQMDEHKKHEEISANTNLSKARFGRCRRREGGERKMAEQIIRFKK